MHKYCPCVKKKKTGNVGRNKNREKDRLKSERSRKGKSIIIIKAKKGWRENEKEREQKKERKKEIKNEKRKKERKKERKNERKKEGNFP